MLLREMIEGGVSVAGEGSLYGMVRRLESMQSRTSGGYRIELTGRLIPPLAYGIDEFDDLIMAARQVRI